MSKTLANLTKLYQQYSHTVTEDQTATLRATIRQLPSTTRLTYTFSCNGYKLGKYSFAPVSVVRVNDVLSLADEKALCSHIKSLFAAATNVILENACYLWQLIDYPDDKTLTSVRIHIAKSMWYEWLTTVQQPSEGIMGSPITVTDSLSPVDQVRVLLAVCSQHVRLMRKMGCWELLVTENGYCNAMLLSLMQQIMSAHNCDAALCKAARLLAAEVEKINSRRS